MPQEETVLTFSAGLAGFENLHQFRLSEPMGSHPLRFLQSVERPDISFVCVDTAALAIGFEVPLAPEDRAVLALGAGQAPLVLAKVVVPEDPREMSADLSQPIVVNPTTWQGLQLSLDPRDYSRRQPIYGSAEDVIVSFPQGLVGLPHLRSFRLFEPSGSYPLKFLQCVENPEVSFVCVDVAAIKMDYEFSMGDEEAQDVALERTEDALVLALVVIPEDPRQMTANLAGPLVINVKTRRGRQIVLSPEAYPLKYPVISDPQGR